MNGTNQFSTNIWLKISRIAETSELVSLWSWTTTRLKQKRLLFLLKIDIRSIVYTSKNHVKCVMVGENVKVFGKIKKINYSHKTKTIEENADW